MFYLHGIDAGDERLDEDLLRPRDRSLDIRDNSVWLIGGGEVDCFLRRHFVDDS